MNDQIYTRRLLRHHKLQIHCWDDDGTRFVKLFRDTWKSLPLTVRRAILRFWRENAPLIELSNMWTPGNSYGQVGRNGMQIKFRQEAFADFPTKAAHWVIAHELAHVYQKACGRPPGGENEIENEDHADGLANEWGHDRICLSWLEMSEVHRGSFVDACESIKQFE